MKQRNFSDNLRTLAIGALVCASSLSNAQKPLSPSKDEKWHLNFQASHGFSHYYPSNICFKTSRYNVTIKDYRWKSRGGERYFDPRNWFGHGENPLKMFDETTNAYTLSLEKKKHVLFLSMFHPKFYQANEQTSHIQGNVNGTTVNQTARVFTPVLSTQSDMSLWRNENTHMQLEFEVGYGHKFDLFKKKMPGHLSYVPALSVGIQAGKTSSFAYFMSQPQPPYMEKFSLQGIGGSIRNKIEWQTKNRHFGVFYENKMSLYHRRHALLDGTQEYDLTYMTHFVGVDLGIQDMTRSLFKRKNHIQKTL